MIKINPTHTFADSSICLEKSLKQIYIKYVYHRGKCRMRISKILNQEVYVEGKKIGQVKDVYVDADMGSAPF